MSDSTSIPVPAFSPEVRASLEGMRAAALIGDLEAMSAAAEPLSEHLGQDGADALACGIVAAGVGVLLAEDRAAGAYGDTIRRGSGVEVPPRPIL
jgi:hypothetical protein